MSAADHEAAIREGITPFHDSNRVTEYGENVAREIDRHSETCRRCAAEASTDALMGLLQQAEQEAEGLRSTMAALDADCAAAEARATAPAEWDGVVEKALQNAAAEEEAEGLRSTMAALDADCASAEARVRELEEALREIVGTGPVDRRSAAKLRAIARAALAATATPVSDPGRATSDDGAAPGSLTGLADSYWCKRP